ncbi:Oxysterol binding protein [Operophtera brumata]|uniref:Oxysterol binding protein n=1 Tax=Operophtera brumata TaxID=104452 RepID=A0A0L7LFL3_OPEBR|nr:Oxysterol binding protein [Operophtera brumata]
MNSEESSRPGPPDVTSEVGQVETAKFLGIWLDQHCNWKAHITQVCDRLDKFVYAIKRLRLRVSIDAALTAYHGYVSAVLAYGLVLWGNSVDVDKAFIIQKKCVHTTVHNIIVGKLWVDNHGDMDILGDAGPATGYVAHLKYLPYGYFSKDTQRKVTGVIKDPQGVHRKRSSLICPSSPSHSKEFTKQVAGEGGKPSPRGSGEFPSEVVIVEGDKDAQDQFEDCVEQNIPELKQAPLLPSPEPIQPRHVRQCRLDKPPNYKV